MRYKINTLFYGRTAAKSLTGSVPIYLRITINGRRFEQSTGRFIEPLQWSAKAGKMKGKHPEATLINNYLDTLKNQVYEIEREMILSGSEITYASFKKKWLGEEEKQPMILEVFKQHNQDISQLTGKDFAAGTVERYKTSLLHTTNFIYWKYKVKDLDISKLNYEFINSYALWLKTVRNCNHNTTMKYLANFKKIVLICLKNGWINRDPFYGFKLSKHEVDRPFLSEMELNDIASRKFHINRLGLVRDIFLFSCYTGLAYADVKKLKRSEVTAGVDGDKWIFTKRQKTQTPSRIPLLPIAEGLMKKYENDPQCIIQEKILPVLSNQKMNSYLKEIADVCGINKNLTFHIARHTFATTVTLSNGVPIETVSKMLGHKNIRTTQHYAKILDLKVSEDMKHLKDRLLKKNTIRHDILTNHGNNDQQHQNHLIDIYQSDL